MKKYDKSFTATLIRRHERQQQKNIKEHYKSLNTPIPYKYLTPKQKVRVKQFLKKYKILFKTRLGDGWFIPDENVTKVKEMLMKLSIYYYQVHGKKIKIFFTYAPWDDIFLPTVTSKKRIITKKKGVALWRVR
jgi:hypothetical protein